MRAPEALLEGQPLDGSRTLSFSGAVAGECRVVVRLDNAEMPPFNIAFIKPSEKEDEA